MFIIIKTQIHIWQMSGGGGGEMCVLLTDLNASVHYFPWSLTSVADIWEQVK
jgi:hypothetical protein